MQLSWPGMRVSRFSTAPGEKVRGHGHDSFHLFCLLDGRMEQAAGNTSVQARPGSIRLSSSHSRHVIDFGDEGGDCIVLHVRDVKLNAGYAEPGTSLFLMDSGLDALFKRLAAPGANPAHLWLTAHETVVRARRWSERPETDRPPLWLDDVRRHLMESPSSNLSRAVRTAGVSAEHLARCFRRFYGVTPDETRRAAMLAHSLTLLKSSEIPLADAALDAGFADQSHLTNVMRRMLGVTPGAYRFQTRA